MTSDFSAPAIELAREADFAIGRLHVRPSISQIDANGRTEILQPRVMQVLVALAQAKGGVVSRNELIARCWEGAAVGEDAITRVVGRLRRLFEDDRDIGLELETIPRIGYRLTAPPNEKTAAQGAARGRASPAGVLSALRRRPRIAAIALMALTAGAAASTWIATSHARPMTIAALQFETLGGGDLQPFAAGLADKIAAVMSANDLRAIPRSRAATFRGSQGARAAARAGVAFIIDGSVRRNGALIHVNAHVDDPRRGVILWSYEAERAAEEDFILQEQAAARVVDVLRCALSANRSHDGAAEAEALSLFLRACEAIRYNAGDWERVRTLALQITERAPRFSRGWSLLAMASANHSYFAPSARAEVLREEARAAAARALQLDRRNADAYLALGALVRGSGWGSGAWAERRAALDKALAAEPDSPDVNHALSWHLFEVGRVEEARRHAERARSLDPLSRRNGFLLVHILGAAGRNAEALAAARRLHPWPDYRAGALARFEAAIFTGSAQDAAEAMAAIGEPPTIWSHAEQSVWSMFVRLRESDDREGKVALRRRIVELAQRDRSFAPTAMAMLSQLRELDAAFTVADAYYSAEGWNTDHLFRASTLNLRRDRRFMRLAARTGLIDYWRLKGQWPDFCADPRWPYECMAEAARLSEDSARRAMRR